MALAILEVEVAIALEEPRITSCGKPNFNNFLNYIQI